MLQVAESSSPTLQVVATKAKVVVPSSVKQQVENVVRKYLEIAYHEYKQYFTMPTIVYTRRGVIAATAYQHEWKISLNPILLMENLDDMINQTVPHEVAHLVAHQVFGRIKVHGREWKSVMRAFSLKSERCHSYDTTNSRVRRKHKRARYSYDCNCTENCCSGPTVFNRVQSGVKYTCKKCKKCLTDCTYRRVR